MQKTISCFQSLVNKEKLKNISQSKIKNIFKFLSLSQKCLWIIKTEVTCNISHYNNLKGGAHFFNIY